MTIQNRQIKKSIIKIEADKLNTCSKPIVFLITAETSTAPNEPANTAFNINMASSILVCRIIPAQDWKNKNASKRNPNTKTNWEANMLKSISDNWKFIRNRVAIENEKMTISESKTNTSHLERKRFEYFRMKEDFVIIDCTKTRANL